jgi:hypothetical protein
MTTAPHPSPTSASHEQFGLEDLVGEPATTFLSARALDEAAIFHDRGDGLARLRTIPALASATTLMSAWDGKSGVVRAWAPLETRAAELFPSQAQVRPLYDAGFNIVLFSVERFVPELQPVCRNLERDLGLATGKIVVEAFCARGGAGARPHFDGTTTLNCQLEGSKVWRLARNPAVRYPPAGMFLGAAVPRRLGPVLRAPVPDRMPDDAREVTVHPGSVVYLPQGTLHETRTESASFAILFSITRGTIGDDIARRVRRRLRRIESLRAPPLEHRAVRDAAVHQAASELRRLADELEASRLLPRRSATPVRFVPGITTESRGGRVLVIRTPDGEHVADVDPLLRSVIEWAERRATPFLSDDAVTELAHTEPATVRRAVKHLVRVGLLELA